MTHHTFYHAIVNLMLRNCLENKLVPVITYNSYNSRSVSENILKAFYSENLVLTLDFLCTNVK